jgi:predicted nucleic acid-binding protein
MKYLLDTNTIIYFIDDLLPKTAGDFIESIKSNVSFITRIELLAWQGLQPAEQLKIETFLNTATLHNCEEAVIIRTIAIRKQHKLKLPDALIAATALVYDLTLLS